MAGHETPSDDSLRDLIRFYLVDHRTPLGKAIDVGVLVLDLAFLAIVVVDTYPIADAIAGPLWTAEVAIASVFLVEYVLRIYSARRRWAEFTDPYTVVDLVAILPTFVVLLAPGIVAPAIGLLRFVRVVRVLRFFRFTKDEEFFFGTVDLGTLRAMKLLLTVLSIFFLYAGFFYNVEHVANPAIRTFGDAFYFAVVSLTTVGFGDITPVTRLGRWLTVSAILLAIILLPWEASRIVRAWTDDEVVDATCPECGLTGHDPDASHCKACGHTIYQRVRSRR
ncbi:MAG: potassium channel family protein [Halorientalis sp.]